MDLEEGIIVTNNIKKESILKNVVGFKNYKFFTINEIKKYVFNYVIDDGIFNCVEKLKITYDHASDMLKYIPFINKDYYNNEKLDSLVSLKNFLSLNSLLKPKLYLQSLPISFIGYPLTKELRLIMDNFPNAKYFNKSLIDKHYIINEFSHINDEVAFVFSKIKELILKGTNINKIFIVNATSDYYFIIDKVSKLFGIPASINESISILSSNEVAYFMHNYYSYNSFEEAIKDLKIKFGSTSYIKKLIDVINNHSFTNYKDSFDYLFYLLKKQKFSKVKYVNSVSVIDTLNRDFEDDDYVFYLGFNDVTSPYIKKDNDFLLDKEKELLGIDTTSDINLVNEKYLMENISNINNLVISFSKKSNFNDYHLSNLKDRYDFIIVPNEYQYGFSKSLDKLTLANDLDNYYKFGDLTETLQKYDTKSVSYNTYDNSYKKVSKDLILKTIPTLRLSYSSMKKYYACPFSFYADKILKLDDFKSNLAAKIGSFAHAIFEDSYSPDFDFSTSSATHMKEASDSKERFYFKVMEELVGKMLEFNQAHEKAGKIDKTLCEKEVNLEYSDTRSFIGFIDKLKYTIINDEVYAYIVDYKTGQDVISLDNVEDGFHLQLPIYMYLLSKSELFKDKIIHILGIYLQKVNIKKFNNNGEDIKYQEQSSYKLQGYTIRDDKLVELIDPGYQKSDYIAGMSTNSSGDFSYYSKVVTVPDIYDLISLSEDLITKAFDNIYNGDFSISPKRIENKDMSCMYCKHKDICFKKYEDYIDLDKKPFF